MYEKYREIMKNSITESFYEKVLPDSTVAFHSKDGMVEPSEMIKRTIEEYIDLSLEQHFFFVIHKYHTIKRLYKSIIEECPDFLKLQIRSTNSASYYVVLLPFINENEAFWIAKNGYRLEFRDDFIEITRRQLEYAVGAAIIKLERGKWFNIYPHFDCSVIMKESIVHPFGTLNDYLFVVKKGYPPINYPDGSSVSSFNINELLRIGKDRIPAIKKAIVAGDWQSYDF